MEVGVTGDIMRAVRWNSGRHFLREQVRAGQAPSGEVHSPNCSSVSELVFMALVFMAPFSPILGEGGGKQIL